MFDHRTADMLIELFRFCPLFLLPCFELNRSPESYRDLMQPGPASSHGEYIEGPLQIRRDNRAPRLRHDHSNTRLRRPEVAIMTSPAFRKNDHYLT